MTTTHTFPFRVRKQSSGRAASVKWIVVKVVDGKTRRVSTWAHNDEADAQYAADELNVAAMVRDYNEDPRPYASRLAEAKTAYTAAKAGA